MPVNRRRVLAATGREALGSHGAGGVKYKLADTSSTTVTSAIDRQVTWVAS